MVKTIKFNVLLLWKQDVKHEKNNCKSAQVDPVYAWFIMVGALGHPVLACHFPTRETTKLVLYLHLIQVFIRVPSHVKGTSQGPWTENELSLTLVTTCRYSLHSCP